MVWIKLSKDDLSLVEAVADSAGKLATLCGVSKRTIQSAHYRYAHGKLPRPTYMRIEIDDDEKTE